MDENGLPIFNEEIGMGKPDGISTLIYTIIKHFVGTPSNITSRIHDQLSNLHCPTLSDFRWYKDVFTSRVMLRDDCTKSFWKEKFINGLPNLFAHKIRDVLSQPTGVIEYDKLTYGDIISTIQKEGLRMCIDMKISKQAQKDKNQAKYELGNFCEQYGLPPVAPSRRKHKKIEDYNKSNKYPKKSKNQFTKDKYYEKPKNQNSKKPYTKKNDKSNITCHNCGKKGHYKNECKVKEKISQLKISNTDKKHILEIFRLENLSNSDSNSEEDKISTSSDYHSFSDDSSENQIEIGCTDNCCKRINVITKELPEEDLLIDLIGKIEDFQLKQQYVKKLKQLLVQQSKKPQCTRPIIDLNATIERFSRKQKEVTLQDLQQEINLIKQDIIKLKDNDKKLKDSITILQLKDSFENFEDEEKHNQSSDEAPELNSKNFHSTSDQEEDDHQECDPESNRLSIINQINIQKWHAKVKLIIDDFEIEVTALIDTGADLNCIQENLIPTRYYQKTIEQLSSANGSRMRIKYKLPQVEVCQDKVCFKTSFVLVQNLTDKVILGVPFICLLYPFTTNCEGITTKPFGQKVIFKFLTKPEQKELRQLKNYSIFPTNVLLDCFTDGFKSAENDFRMDHSTSDS
jgi:hypothetical protein